MNKILVIGDMHLKQKLGYADYISDGRFLEKQEILNAIVKESEDCDYVVFMGDNFNDRNPVSSVVRDFTEFLEMFKEKEIIIIAGNHEIKNDGSTAIDYLSRIKGKNWYIVTDMSSFNRAGVDFACISYLTKGKLEVESNDEAVKKIMELLKNGIKHFKDDTLKILFHHHAMTGTFVQSGQSVDDFPEPVLPVDKLTKMFDMVIGGHIHSPKEYQKNKVIVTGSIFNNEIGEDGKFLWKIDTQEKKVEKIKLPGRAIYGIEDEKKLDKLPKNSIVKFTLKEKKTDDEIEQIKDKLSKFDAYVFLEKVPKERKKLHYGKGESMLEFSIEELLKVYAEEQNIDYNKLVSAFAEINK